MIIISWDVGIIHLAYCILEYLFNEVTKKISITILDWDVLNLVENERIKLQCCGKLKAKKGIEPKTCGKKAGYFLNTEEKMIGFCKTHLAQHSQYWSETDTQKLFKVVSTKNTCTYLKKDGTTCDKKCKCLFKNGDEKFYYCTAHYKSELKKKTKEFSPQPIKNLIIRKYPTADLQLCLIKKLDELAEHFAILGVEEVVIENQPSMKNPKMKAIAATLFDYFMIRGYVDKIHNIDIKLVRFMCPSNKLKVNNNNTIEVFRANKDSKKKYKLTKALSIQYTKQLLSLFPEQLEYLSLYKKQDDICDAYLQGRYYLEFIRNSDAKKNIKKKPSSRSIKNMEPSGSKTAKPKLKPKQNKLPKKKRKSVVISL